MQESVNQSQGVGLHTHGPEERQSIDALVEKINERLQGLQGLGHPFAHRQEHVPDGRVEVNPKFFDAQAGGDQGTAIAPVPVELQVALQPRHALNARGFEHGAETHRRLAVDGAREPAATDLVAAGYPSAAIAAQVQADGGGQAAVLEAGGVGVGILFDQVGLPEQQLGGGAEGATARPVEQGLDFEPDLRGAVGAGAQVEAVGQAETEAKVKGPTELQLDASVDIKGHARDVELEGQVEARLGQGLPQLHVELHRISAAGQLGAGAPQADVGAVAIGETVGVAVVPAHFDVGAVDHTVEVGVLQNAELVVQQLEQGFLQDRNRAAFRAQAPAQVAEEAGADVADEHGGLGGRGADQGQRGSQQASHGVLDAAQGHVDTVKHPVGVVENPQQRQFTELVFNGRPDVGQRQLQHIAGTGAPAGQVQQLLKTPVGRLADAEAAGIGLEAPWQGELQGELHAHLALDLHAEVGADGLAARIEASVVTEARDRSLLVEDQAEAGPVVGAGAPIAIDRDPTIAHAQVGGAGAEAQVEVFALHLEPQAGVGAAGLVDGHGLPPRHPDLAELQLARRVAEPVRASGQQHHRYAEVLTEALLQVQNRLHPVGGKGGAP